MRCSALFFGAVNGSMWEQTKVVMLSYLVWSLVEAIGKRSGFHRFAVSRIISLWFVGIFCLAYISANLCTRC